MKPLAGAIGKQNPRRAFYWTIAIACLVYAGVALILLVQQAMLLNARGPSPGEFERNLSLDRGTASLAAERNETLPGQLSFRRREFVPSFFLYVNLLGAIISLLAGLSLISLLRHRESRELKKEVIDSMVTPEEKAVIHELSVSHGELTQSDLVRKTGLSKVKVHRIIKRLESLGVVKKYPYGMTNKIKLEKSLLVE